MFFSTNCSFRHCLIKHSTCDSFLRIYEKLIDSIETQNIDISNAIANYVQVENHHDSKKCQCIKISKVLRQNISRHKNNDLNKALKLLTTMKKKKKKDIVIDFCYMHLIKIVDHFEFQTRKFNKIEFKHRLNIIYNRIILEKKLSITTFIHYLQFIHREIEIIIDNDVCASF